MQYVGNGDAQHALLITCSYGNWLQLQMIAILACGEIIAIQNLWCDSVPIDDLKNLRVGSFNTRQENTLTWKQRKMVWLKTRLSQLTVDVLLKCSSSNKVAHGDRVDGCWKNLFQWWWSWHQCLLFASSYLIYHQKCKVCKTNQVSPNNIKFSSDQYLIVWLLMHHFFFRLMYDIPEVPWSLVAEISKLQKLAKMISNGVAPQGKILCCTYQNDFHTWNLLSSFEVTTLRHEQIGTVKL